jgi:phage terminase large subunit-like protein
MVHAREVWGGAATTVAPGGSCHIVTRGSGEHHYAAELWHLAGTADSPLVSFFAPYDARPGRDALWRESQRASMHHAALLHFAPETAADALAGDEEQEFIAAPIWDGCFDPELPSIAGDSRTPLVLGLDIGLRQDFSAVVAVSRHPSRPEDAAIRAVHVFRPGENGGTVDLDAVEQFIRQVAAVNYVVMLAYDEWQAASIAQRLQHDGVTWVKPFGQGTERAVADSALAQMAHQRKVFHNGDPDLRQAILNARAHLTGVDERQLRMVKRAAGARIDAAVAASMAVDRCLRLNL